MKYHKYVVYRSIKYLKIKLDRDVFFSLFNLLIVTTKAMNKAIAITVTIANIMNSMYINIKYTSSSNIYIASSQCRIRYTTSCLSHLILDYISLNNKNQVFLQIYTNFCSYYFFAHNQLYPITF